MDGTNAVIVDPTADDEIGKLMLLWYLVVRYRVASKFQVQLSFIFDDSEQVKHKPSVTMSSEYLFYLLCRRLRECCHECQDLFF